MAERNDPTARRGRPPVSANQRDRRRLAVSRHAVRLFRQHGVAATSGEQIARAAGISERTLWRYFRSKEACVEPLLTKTLDAFRTVLRTWPPHVELAEHLRASYTPITDTADADFAAVLAVVRMTHDEPGLRAVYLVLRERADATLAEALAARGGHRPDSLPVRMRAAAVNAALCAATDDLVATAEDGLTPEVVHRHRERLADFLHLVTTDSPAVA